MLFAIRQKPKDRLEQLIIFRNRHMTPFHPRVLATTLLLVKIARTKDERS